MEIVLHIGSLFPCWKPDGFPAKQASTCMHTHCSSTHLRGHALPTSSPLLLPGTGTWDARAPSCGAGTVSVGKVRSASWQCFLCSETFVKTSYLQNRPQQSKQGLKIDSKTFNTDNTMQLEKEPFAGVPVNIVHPILCHPRWWGHKGGRQQRGFQTNKWARENCLMWNYWSLFFI